MSNDNDTDWTALHGQIIDFSLWVHQCNVRSLNKDQTTRILKANGIELEKLAKLQPSNLIVINHNESVRAICMDSENNYRFIAK